MKKKNLKWRSRNYTHLFERGPDHLCIDLLVYLLINIYFYIHIQQYINKNCMYVFFFFNLLQIQCSTATPNLLVDTSIPYSICSYELRFIHITIKNVSWLYICHFVSNPVFYCNIPLLTDLNLNYMSIFLCVYIHSNPYILYNIFCEEIVVLSFKSSILLQHPSPHWPDHQSDC